MRLRAGSRSRWAQCADASARSPPWLWPGSGSLSASPFARHTRLAPAYPTRRWQNSLAGSPHTSRGRGNSKNAPTNLVTLPQGPAWSFDDGLIHKLLDLAAIVGAARPRCLVHHHPHKLLLGLDPEERACIASPHELSLRSRHRRKTGLLANHESQPERIALNPHQQLARRHRAADARAELVGGHQRHGGRTEKLGIVQSPAVQKHLTEAQIIACRRDAARPTGVLLRRLRYVDQMNRLRCGRIRGQGLRDARELLRRHPEPAIRHPEWLEQPLRQEVPKPLI